MSELVMLPQEARNLAMAAAAESGSPWRINFAEYRGEKLVVGLESEGEKPRRIEVFVGHRSAEAVKQEIIRQLVALG
jgi:hypothetical protein